MIESLMLGKLNKRAKNYLFFSIYVFFFLSRTHSVVSPIDNKSMTGIPSIRVHRGTEISNASRLLRWTEVFIIQVCPPTPTKQKKNIEFG